MPPHRSALVLAGLLIATATPAAAQQVPTPQAPYAPRPATPRWITKPAPEAPVPADPASPDALVDLACVSQPDGGVTDCVVTYEDTAGPGLGASVLKAVESASMSPLTVDGMPQASPFRFVVRFRASGSPFVTDPAPPPPPGEPVLILTPSWARQPQPVFPPGAYGRGRGRVTLNCGFLSSGDLIDCELKEESPEGAGFGAAAMVAAPRGRFFDRRAQEAPAGSRLEFTTQFVPTE